MLLRFLSVGFFAPLALLVSAASTENSLADSPSAFVRAQAASAVHWHAWTPETLAAAQKQDKSVYVFIGSPLSELTRATVKQTFTSEKTVAWLNENFFCIFVDADAQPDIAMLGQYYIRTIKQLQGWPVHLWLTPELQPYDGANYLPPSEEWGKPGFLKAARSALDAWAVDPARARALASEALDLMRVPPLEGSAPMDVEKKLAAAAKAWVAAIDPVNGGFGSAPKQPEPEVIRFLLTRPDAASRDAAINAARALVKGALRDPVDGGFYRRCIDEEWKEPYFQKTLNDQARIALALFEAADAAKDDSLRAAGVGALDFVLKELRYPNGSFAAALDGTLDENLPAGQRPKFEKIGLASLGAQSLLVAALLRSEREHLLSVSDSLLPGLKAIFYGKPNLGLISRSPTAADSVALALAARIRGDKPDNGRDEAARILAETSEQFFDANAGVFMQAPVKLPIGIALRVPSPGDTPSTEVLALMAGVDAKTAALIRRGLLAAIEYDEQPSGDILLGLTQKP